MVFTRRRLLEKIIGTGLSLVGTDALANDEKTFLYELTDYTNPDREPYQFKKLNLQDQKGVSVIHVWADFCKPCIGELAQYNGLFNHFKNDETVSIISALYKNILDYEPLEPNIHKAIYGCMQGFLIKKYRYGTKKFNNAIDNFIEGEKNGKQNITELRDIKQKCDNLILDSYENGSHPKLRNEFGNKIEKLKKDGTWLRAPCYILDDDKTYDFLQRGSRKGELPFTTFLIDGKYQLCITGPKKVKEVERVLKLISRNLKTIKKKR